MKISKEAVMFSLDRDEEYCRTHRIDELGWELPSGISNLDYISIGNPEFQHYRQLVHVATGEFVPKENVYFDENDKTWNVRVNHK